MNYSAIELLSLVYSFLVLIKLYNIIGKKIGLMEYVSGLTVLTCLIMPSLFYHYFINQSELVKYFMEMPIDSTDYYYFVFPAVVCLNFGLTFRRNEHLPLKIKSQLKEYVCNKKNYTFYLFFIGVIAGFLAKVSNSMIAQVFVILNYLTYVGFLFIIFSDNKYKNVIIFIYLLYFINNIVNSGMYTDLISFGSIIGLTLLAIFRIGKLWKVYLLFCSVFTIFFIQIVKTEYRLLTWDGDKRNGNTSTFANIVADRINNVDMMLEPMVLMEVSRRLNHGYTLAKVMNNVPEIVDFGRGYYLVGSISSAFVPRFIWPDKPKTGGAYNILHFLQDYSSVEDKNAYNLGIIGEGYAHFGYLSLIYLFIIGRFMSFVYSYLIRKLQIYPSLILWYPMIFISFLAVESDLVSFFNSLTKVIFVLYVIFNIFRKSLNIKLGTINL